MKIKIIAPALALILFVVYFFLMQSDTNNRFEIITRNETEFYKDNTGLNTNIFSISNYENYLYRSIIRFQTDIALQKNIEEPNTQKYDTLQITNDCKIYLQGEAPKSLFITTQKKYTQPIQNYSDGDSSKPINPEYTKHDYNLYSNKDGVFMSVVFYPKDGSNVSTIEAELYPIEKTKENYKKLNTYSLAENYKQMYSTQPTCNVVKKYKYITSTSIDSTDRSIEIPLCTLNVEGIEAVFSAQFRSYKPD